MSIGNPPRDGRSGHRSPVPWLTGAVGTLPVAIATLLVLRHRTERWKAGRPD